jgi:ABC-type transport system substrate-binding protein
MWAQAGINVKINIVEPSVWTKYHKAGPAVAYKEALAEGKTHEEAVNIVHAGEPPADPGASPGLVYFAPGGEYFDFGRQINYYMNCTSVRSSNCDADSHTLGQQALAAGGEERRRLMEEVYEIFTDRLYQIPVMEIVSVWRVNKDLDYTNMPGERRILLNTSHFK